MVSPDEESRIVTDEDWKERVKAEAAALDQRLRGDEQSQPQSAPAQPQFPPADFLTLVSMFSTQALVALGLIANPITGKADVQLGLAKHFIDMLGVLENKTAGNLEPREASILSESLHQLRMAFVEQSKHPVSVSSTGEGGKSSS